MNPKLGDILICTSSSKFHPAFGPIRIEAVCGNLIAYSTGGQPGATWILRSEFEAETWKQPAVTTSTLEIRDESVDGINWYFVYENSRRAGRYLARFPYDVDGLRDAKLFVKAKSGAS